MADQLCKLQFEQDQDEMNAVEWFNRGDTVQELKVWLAIQRMGGDSMTETISRFAQLGFTHAKLMAERRKAGG